MFFGFGAAEPILLTDYSHGADAAGADFQGVLRGGLADLRGES